MRAIAPIAALGHAEPAFLLQEVEEDDLPHEFLGKVGGADIFGGEFRADGFVLLREVVEFVFEVVEERIVLPEELLGDGFDAEGVFDLRQRGTILGFLEQVEKARLRGVAAFALADDVGTAAGGRETFFDGDLSSLGVTLGFVFHADKGKPP